MAEPRIPKRDYYVYVLFRENGHPFYVGKGRGQRIDTHLSTYKFFRTHKDRIIRRMVSSGLDIPRVKVAERLSEPEALAIERLFIVGIGRQPSGPLVNLTDGGEGPCNLDDETRERMGSAHRGKKHRTPRSPEHRAKISLARKGKRLHAKTIAGHRRTMLGRITPEATKQKLRAYRHTDSAKKKIAAASRQQWQSNDGYRAKMAQGRPHTEESKKKMRSSALGRTITDEAKAKMRAAKMGKPWTTARRAAFLTTKDQLILPL